MPKGDVIGDILALGPGAPRVQCATCHAILTQPELDPAIRGAISNGATRRAVALVLQNHGYDVSEDSIQKHLKKGHQPL